MKCNEMKLIDIANKMYSGGTPSRKNKDFWEDGNIPWLKTNQIGEYQVFDTEEHITKLALENSSTKLVKKNSIIIAMYGDGITRGKVSLAGKELTTNQACCILEINEEIANFKYVYFALKNNYKKLRFLSNGGAQQNLSVSNLKEFSISLLELHEQKKVGEFLHLLELKMQNNNKIIQSLEQLSQSLFKNWFIDFEFPNEEGKPYKSSGGEMVESELGNIPKSWTYSYFSNFVKQTVGGDWGKENVEKNYVEQVSIIRGADIPELTKGTDNKIPTRFILKKNYENKKLLSGDIVIEISGGSPTQSTGRSIFINENIISRYNDKVLCTNFCRIIRPVDFDKGLWLQMYINYLYKKNVFFNFENGTTGIKNLDLNAILNKYKIVSPSEDVIHLFSEKIKVILTSIQNLGMENKRLAKLRDTLLPKLLSGEIEIPDDLEV